MKLIKLICFIDFKMKQKKNLGIKKNKSKVNGFTNTHTQKEKNPVNQ